MLEEVGLIRCWFQVKGIKFKLEKKCVKIDSELYQFIICFLPNKKADAEYLYRLLLDIGLLL
jgi:hypothetical protein